LPTDERIAEREVGGFIFVGVIYMDETVEAEREK